MKAGMNGVINLSVLDGWWAEGYDGSNGWAIKPAAHALDQASRSRRIANALRNPAGPGDPHVLRSQ
jgi:starch phosphorylase